MRCKLNSWFWAFSKRILRKRFFVVLLCIFPMLSVTVRIYGNSESPLLQVALYNEGGTELAEDTIFSLTELNSTISFYEVTSEEQLYRDVKTTRAECGYIFTKKYNTDHILDGQNRKKSVKAVKSPASILAGSINELVFAAYFKEYNKQLLTDYLGQPDVIKDGQNTDSVIRNAIRYFEQYALNENILQSETGLEQGQNVTKEQLAAEADEVTREFMTNAMRGVLSVLILLASLCGGVQLHKDRKNGLFGSVSPDMKWKIRLLDILAYVLPVAVTGYVGILLLTAGRGFGKEFLGLVFCVVTAVLFAAALENLSGSLYPVLIPLFVMGALVFAPVFMDFSVYAKILVIPKYLFVNTYYLELVRGGGRELARAGLVSVVMGILNYLLWFGKEKFKKKNI